MADRKTYVRDANGSRFVLQGGMNIYRSLDLLQEGEYAYLQNVRRYLDGRIRGRATMGDPLYTLGAPPHTIRRLNDSTPAGPVAGYVRVIGAAGLMYVDATEVGSGYSGNPDSFCPFRPNASVQPWMYVGDSSESVVITTKFAIDDSPTTFDCFGMTKIRSDGLIYKTGIKEGQVPPTVTTTGTTTSGTDALPATTIPWTNVSGANPSYNYGHTSGGDGTSPVIISTPAGAQTLELTVTGTATVNGATHAPGDVGPATATFPANFISAGGGSPTIVLGAFTDGSGNVLAGGGPIPIVCAVGASATLTVPAGAVRFQVGIDSSANTFSANSGSFSIDWTLTSSAIATTISTLGNVTAYYFGDSPHSGPVSVYIWKNPNDTGTGIPRTSGQAIAPLGGTVSNNSWEFDSSPQNGTVPLLWNTLNSSGTITGSIPVFDPALESEGYQDFNMCVVGTIFVPTAGTYNFTFANKDQIMVGIGGGATVAGGYVTGSAGQTMSVISGLPLVYVSTPSGGGGTVFHTVAITFAESGSYDVELDYDYWFHNGRALYMLLGTFASLPTPPTGVIPPLPQGVRTNVSYAYKYRSSLTGAVSNPSPETTPQLTPVLDNTISSEYSPDPQVDKVDYYRQDSGLANYTYVATGPNDGLGGTVGGIIYNTAITDSLPDLDAADNPTMDVDDFEPFPSIDLPKAGVVNVSGGIITWVSGDQFNTRWLAGTIIEIGSPTQLAYSLYSRPTSATSMFIPNVPDGTNLVYNISEPILAAQPLPYMWGPTDNTAYMFAVGDPLRPGTLYFTKGNNPDSAPDTNQIEVTSPSEPLMNGVIVNGIGMVFSTEEAWLIYPTFATALATVEGVSGQAFNLIQSISNRGLYISTAICTEAGKNVFFRAKDGVYVSPGGAGSQSITDAQLFNLFPHEGFMPSPVVIGPYTVYPPDDTQPNLQTLRFANGYLYYDYGYSTTGPVQESAAFIPASVTTTGQGIAWMQPANATGTGVGSNIPVVITGFSIIGNVASFSTTTQGIPLAAGQTLVMSSLSVGTYFNGQTLTVSASGLSTTSFSANFTHANVSPTVDQGFATPTTTFTYANNNQSYTSPAGQYTVFSFPTGPDSGASSDAGSCFGASFAGFGYLAVVNAVGGVNGCPLGSPTVSDASAFCDIPTLPAGAVVQSIIPVVQGTSNSGLSSALIDFEINYPGGPHGWLLNGTLETTTTLGTSLSVLSSTFFSMSARCTLEQPPGSAVVFAAYVPFYGVAVNYTLASGSPIPSDQLQTLTATQLGLSIPGTAPVTGVVVTFNSGVIAGSADLTIQLTLNGTPVGTPKTLNVGSWATSYSLGAPTDLWGISSLIGSQVNGSSGLGVDISGSLPNGSQVNLNELAGTVYYDGSEEITGLTTLVFDVAAKGWSVDIGNPTFTAHALDEGPNVNDTVVGCSDNTVRVLQADGSEVATSIIATGSNNAGDARAFKRLGDVFIKALVAASNPITVAMFANRYQSVIGGFAPTSLTGSGGIVPYIIDFTSGFADDLIDVALSLSWNTSATNYADLWQPDFIPLPESTQDRPTDWDDAGSPGNKFVQGLMLEADTSDVPKTFSVQRSDDLAIFTPNEVPVSFDKQSIKPFTFTPPFLAHSMRIVSTDGVPWQHAPELGWRMNWVTKPFPESTVEWQTEMMSHGLRGFQHIRAMNIAYQSNDVVTLTFVFDDWPTITLTLPSTSGEQTKLWVQMPPNKFKLVSYRLSSNTPFFVWEPDIEIYVKWWGDTGGYQLLKPFGGPSAQGAEV